MRYSDSCHESPRQACGVLYKLALSIQTWLSVIGQLRKHSSGGSGLPFLDSFHMVLVRTTPKRFTVGIATYSSQRGLGIDVKLKLKSLYKYISAGYRIVNLVEPELNDSGAPKYRQLKTQGRTDHTRIYYNGYKIMI